MTKASGNSLDIQNAQHPVLSSPNKSSDRTRNGKNELSQNPKVKRKMDDPDTMGNNARKSQTRKVSKTDRQQKPHTNGKTSGPTSMENTCLPHEMKKLLEKQRGDSRVQTKREAGEAREARREGEPDKVSRKRAATDGQGWTSKERRVGLEEWVKAGENG